MHHPENYIQKQFLETIGWVILDCGMKIVYMNCWKKLCTAICRKLSENCICKYALCPGIKKINSQYLFQHVTYSYKCIKFFFLHNIAPRMNGILENFTFREFYQPVHMGKKHKLVLIFSCVDWNNANELSLSYPKQHQI